MLRKFQENSCLAFVVNRTSTKIQIRNAFKAIYNVDPVKINADKQIILIGDDMKTYQLDGNQLTLTEGDGDQDIYTKQ